MWANRIVRTALRLTPRTAPVRFASGETKRPLRLATQLAGFRSSLEDSTGTGKHSITPIPLFVILSITIADGRLRVSLPIWCSTARILPARRRYTAARIVLTTTNRYLLYRTLLYLYLFIYIYIYRCCIHAHLPDFYV